MTIFDQIFYFLFSRFKEKYKKKANSIALFYTSGLQITLTFLLGCFFAAFLNQLHVNTMSKEKAYTIFILVSLFIHLKNWISYNGKTRKVMNAKFNKKKAPKFNMFVLLLLPIISIGMGLLFLQAA